MSEKILTGFTKRFTKNFCEEVEKDFGKNFSSIIETHGFEGLGKKVGEPTMDIIGGKVGRNLGYPTRIHTINKMPDDYKLTPIFYLVSEFKEHMEQHDIIIASGTNVNKPNELFITTNGCVLNDLGKLCGYSTEFLRLYLKADKIEKMTTIKQGADNCVFRLTYNKPLTELTKEYFMK